MEQIYKHNTDLDTWLRIEGNMVERFCMSSGKLIGYKKAKLTAMPKENRYSKSSKLAFLVQYGTTMDAAYEEWLNDNKIMALEKEKEIRHIRNWIEGGIIGTINRGFYWDKE